MQSLKTPNVYRNENDKSQVTSSTGTSTGAIVLSAKKGLVNQRLLVATDKELIDTVGIPIPNAPDVGIYAGLEFLKESNALYIVRATSGTEQYANIAVTGTDIATPNGTAIKATASTGLEVNTPTKIADLDGANSSARLLIACKGPGVYGNNIGVTLITSGGGNAVDWTEKYEPSISGSIYKLSVYVKNDSGVYPSSADEVFYGSNTYQKDSSGQQLFIKEVVNGRSQYIYVDCTEDSLPAMISGATNNGIVSLSGGLDASTVPIAKQDLAWNLFKQRTDVDINILMNTAKVPSVAPATIASYRLDCFACLQIGLSADNYSTILSSTYPVVSQQSYAGVYAGWDKIYDKFNDREVFIPKCVFAGAIMARTDRAARTWDAPAGTNRGIIPSIAQNITFTDEQIGELYDRNINTSRLIRGVGNVMWGQKTAQKKKSALDRINVRRLLLFIENSLEPFLQSFLFELNTDKVRLRVFDGVDSFMKGVKAGDGVTSYQVVCDATNNTPLTIDNNELVLDIFVRPSKSIEYIRLNITITRTGVSFQEVR